MKNRQRQKDTLFSILIFCSAFAVNLLIQKLFTTQTLVPMIFVFGVFLISLKTHGYCYGITSAIVSVFAVNFAFTYPYYVFDFFVGESILSAVIMLAVAVSTSTLNIRIRDQERLRSENEKERMRGNLLRAISHDLRTPLTNINGSVGILMGKDQTLKPEVREQLYTAIDDDTNWLINMTENLLAATQLETDRTKLKTAPELLEDLFQSAVRQLDRRARDHHISVDLEDQTLMASMNAGMIQRVIINMMNNAIQYTPKDSHIILSGTRRKDWVEISVSDDGPGIPDEAKKHLFDLFYTAEQGKPDSKRGLGLGLHLCQSIVNAHGGTITVSDHAPSGTTFRFTLPAVRTDGVK